MERKPGNQKTKETMQPGKLKPKTRKVGNCREAIYTYLFPKAIPTPDMESNVQAKNTRPNTSPRPKIEAT